MSYLKLLIISLMCIFFQQIVYADIYPSKSIRLIVPATAGGTTDIAARTIADPLL